ncbi:STAS domain-containing protein [uncultured Novosphingobium sp.]|nr:STAS domain-containing protein [uncultured Novosphingobium sp.]
MEEDDVGQCDEEMSMTAICEASGAGIVLPARCDRAAAEVLLPEFVAAVGLQPISIDGSGVEHVGQAVLQLLVSARRSGGGAVITASPALLDAVQLTGLESELFEEAAL